MGRPLRGLGLTMLVVAIGLLLAGEFGWLPMATVNAAFRPLAIGGAISIGLSLLLALLTPVSRRIRRGHCVRCGAPTERGQTYCLDHMRSAVDEYRDQMRGRSGF